MTTSPKFLGSVQQLWRYPVKSLLGERCATLDFGKNGVSGDRIYAIRDADGKFGSGKNTRRMRKIDGLFKLRAVFDDNQVTVHLPGGRSMAANDASISGILSSELGLPVTLADCTETPLVDVASVHLLTTAALAWLKTALPESHIDERRFRPNVLIETPDNAPLEHTWVDRTIQIGDTATLRIIDRTERCGMVALAQSELPDDPRALRHITEYAGLEFGVYADVIVPGRVQRGDAVSLVE
jgi:uncharacterized protein YcbX